MLTRDWRSEAGGPRFVRSHRVVTQAERVWIIREADASLAPNAPADHCLVCESALTVRCAWKYPREWAHLPDADLLKLFS